MAVDEPRHQRSPAAVDHLGIADLDRPIGNLSNLIIFDEKLLAADEFIMVGIEQRKILEMK